MPSLSTNFPHSILILSVVFGKYNSFRYFSASILVRLHSSSIARRKGDAVNNEIPQISVNHVSIRIDESQWYLPPQGYVPPPIYTNSQGT